MSATKASPKPAEIGYAEALAELEAILTQLEDERLNIDDLADHLARASELVAICRSRLEVAKARVTEIVADLDEQAT